jgi:hypothetical protein
MDSVKNLEKTIEAAKALLSEEKILAGEKSADEPLTESKNLIRTGNNLTPFEQGLIPKTVDATKHKGALGRSKAPYYLFSAAFCIWVVLLLAVYLPISGLVTPTFPLTISNDMMMPFLVSASVASIISLFIGISKLRRKE